MSQTALLLYDFRCVALLYVR